MTTKASTTKKRSRAKATAKKEINGKKLSVLQIQNLPLGSIKPDPEQPRKTFNEDALQQLSESIENHGVLQPITVRQLNGHYVIVMGERRYRASQSAPWGLLGSTNLHKLVGERRQKSFIEL